MKTTKYFSFFFCYFSHLVIDNRYMQRITVSEIKKHPWFLKGSPVEYIEGEEASLQKTDAENPSQSMEEVSAIIQEAQKKAKLPNSGEGYSVGGSMDLDDTDCDISDIKTSEDFICAL